MTPGARVRRAGRRSDRPTRRVAEGFCMTVLEAGMIAGLALGVAAGGVHGWHYGAWQSAGGAAVGAVAGAAAGGAFAAVLIGLLAVVGVLWRAARGDGDHVPSESEIRMMTPPAVTGIFVTAMASAVVLFVLGWAAALVVAFGSALVTAFVAVGRCELRRPG